MICIAVLSALDCQETANNTLSCQEVLLQGKDPEGNGHFVGGVEGAWIRTGDRLSIFAVA